MNQKPSAQESASFPTLDATFTLIERNTTTARFLVPAGYALESASCDGADVQTALEADGQVLAVSLRAETTGDYALALKFSKK